jgi:spermidine synthase
MFTRRNRPVTRVKPAIKPRKSSKLLVRLFFALLVLIVIINAGFLVRKKYSRGSGATPANVRTLLESRESQYNNIYVYQTGTNVSLTFGLNQKIYTESVYNTADELELPAAYTQYMTSSLIYPKKINSILEIGAGGGRIAWYLHRFLPTTQITTVEIDPAVVEIAHKYFAIKDEPNFNMVSRDGRLFLADSKQQYDVILIDAYRGPFVPFHLLTKEFYQVVKNHLAPGGVIAQNVEPTTMLFDSAVKTVQTVFAHVEFYDANAGNVVMIAYDGDGISRGDLNAMADKRQSAYHFRYDLPKMLKDRFELKTVVLDQVTHIDVVNQDGMETAEIDPKAKILTDDFAPVESLKAIARHNEKWINHQ